MANFASSSHHQVKTDTIKDMPVEMFTDGLEPEDQEAIIWRFMKFWKFKDLITTQELHFCRADLLEDESEGLPPQDYVPILGLDPVLDAQELTHNVGSIAQFREAFFINCWYMFAEETAKMWVDYGNDAVRYVRVSPPEVRSGLVC